MVDDLDLDTLTGLRIAIESMRAAFSAAATSVSKDRSAAGVVFAAHMLDEAFSAFDTAVVRYVRHKLEGDDADEEGL
jgi:hypothetical protein